MRGIGKNIYRVLGFAISIVCLYFAFRGIEWIQVSVTFRKANFFWLILSILFQLLSLAIAGFRWKTVINLPEVSWTSASASMLVGLMVNNILPGRMGEFVRPILLGQEIKRSKAFLFATVVIDRISDLLVLLILGLLSFSMFPFIPWARQMSIVGGWVLVLALLVIGIFSYSNVGLKIEKIICRYGPTLFYERVAHSLQKIRLGFRSFQSIQRGAAVFGLSWLVWTAWFLFLYYALNAFRLILPIWGVILLLSTLNLGGVGSLLSWLCWHLSSLSHFGVIKLCNQERGSIGVYPCLSRPLVCASNTPWSYHSNQKEPQFGGIIKE